jgi:transcriptional regulator with PAS, ATPase and Fis domain
MQKAIQTGKFREDLFYRLSTVPIHLPSLKNRKEDIHLIFRKFAHDFAEKYRMPSIKLKEDAIDFLNAYNWPGNIRQLRNLVEQLSVIETERDLDLETIRQYLPENEEQVPIKMNNEGSGESYSEREIMYKFLFDMKKDLTELKKLVLELIKQDGNIHLNTDQTAVINRIHQELNSPIGTTRVLPTALEPIGAVAIMGAPTDDFEIHEEIEESLSLEDREKELIQKALEKHRGKRKYAAQELGISERTLYRKIKEFNLLD